MDDLLDRIKYLEKTFLNKKCDCNNENINKCDICNKFYCMCCDGYICNLCQRKVCMNCGISVDVVQGYIIDKNLCIRCYERNITKYPCGNCNDTVTINMHKQTKCPDCHIDYSTKLGLI